MNKGLQALMAIPMNQVAFEINGVKYIAKELNGEQYKAYQKDIVTIQSKDVQKISSEKVVSSLVFHSICNEDGSKVFEDNDRALVDKLPKHILDELFQHAGQVNGMDTDEKEKEKN